MKDDLNRFINYTNSLDDFERGVVFRNLCIYLLDMAISAEDVRVGEDGIPYCVHSGDYLA